MTITSFKGDAKTYANAMEILVRRGDNLDDLNKANHYALEQGHITMEEFMAAARILAKEILRR